MVIATLNFYLAAHRGIAGMAALSHVHQYMAERRDTMSNLGVMTCELLSD